MPEFSELPENIRKVIFFTKIKRGLQEIAEATNGLIEFNHDISTELGDLTNEMDLCRSYFMFLVLFTKIVVSSEFKKIINDIETYSEEKCDHRWRTEVVESEVDRTTTYTICGYCDTVKDE